jgi:hypothetical protein
VIDIAARKPERISHSNFGGVQPPHGKVLNLKRFEFGAIDHDTADRQSSNRQCADRECANRDRAERSRD